MLLVLLGGLFVLLRFTLFRPALVPVTVHRVAVGRVEDTVVNSRAGTVQSRRRARISPGIAGLVVEIPVREGARVKEGDVLLRLDDRELRARLHLARRSLEAAQAQAEQAQLELQLAQYLSERTRTLVQDNVVSDLTAEAARRAAEAREREAEAAIETAQALLDKTVIAAPFAGVVLDVTTEVGEWISPSPPGVFIPPVVDLIDPDALYLEAPLDEADVARVRSGLPVRVTLDAFRGQAFAGTLTYVSSFVETRQEQNRTLRVEAAFSTAELPSNLLPGLSADLEVILDAREAVLRIPTYALLEGGRVLLVQQGQLVERSVSTGLRNWSFTEITAGLAAGEDVVVSLDRAEVKAGVRVTVTGEAAE
jgi:HlyD family secretion protein